MADPHASREDDLGHGSAFADGILRNPAHGRGGPLGVRASADDQNAHEDRYNVRVYNCRTHPRTP